MPFSANYRRVRGPQNPQWRFFLSRAAVMALAVCIIYVLFCNTAAKQIQSLLPTFDDSNPSFPFTNYRAAVNLTGQKFWASINRGFKCPITLLSKVGVSPEQSESNGKFVCGFRNLAKLQSKLTEKTPPCVVYSFTLEGESYFENEFLDKTNCSVYQFDPMRNMDIPTIPNERYTFQRIGISDEDRGEQRTLELLLELNGHRWIDILRIEVPTGMEYAALERILNDFRDRPIPIGQMIVKFHVRDWIISGRSEWLVRLFEAIEMRGFRLFYNQFSMFNPCCTEMSFINVNHLERFLDSDEGFIGKLL